MSLPNKRQDDNSCGEKFRAMLKCVERSGDISACNVMINRFLACERAVFQSALRSNSHQSSTPSSHGLPSSSLRRSQLTTPSSDEQSETPSSTHLDRLASLPALVQRACDKQLHACSSLLDTLSQPNYSHRIVDFTKRIAKDAYLTCSLVTSKIAQTVSRYIKNDSAHSNDRSK